jgi:hypothetical protein
MFACLLVFRTKLMNFGLKIDEIQTYLSHFYHRSVRGSSGTPLRSAFYYNYVAIRLYTHADGKPTMAYLNVASQV